MSQHWSLCSVTTITKVALPNGPCLSFVKCNKPIRNLVRWQGPQFEGWNFQTFWFERSSRQWNWRHEQRCEWKMLGVEVEELITLLTVLSTSPARKPLLNTMLRTGPPDLKRPFRDLFMSPSTSKMGDEIRIQNFQKFRLIDVFASIYVLFISRIVDL